MVVQMVLMYKFEFLNLKNRQLLCTGYLFSNVQEVHWRDATITAITTIPSGIIYKSSELNFVNFQDDFKFVIQSIFHEKITRLVWN
jgi:hypothetical protein